MKRLILTALIVYSFFFFAAHSSRSQNQKEETVVFSAKIVVDQFYQNARKHIDWRHSAANLIEQLNQEFQSQNIKIKIEVAEISLWLIDKKTDTLEEALYELRAKFPQDNCDLVIGLTRKKFSWRCDAGGYYLSPAYIIAKDYAEFDSDKKEIAVFQNWTLMILIHEIGHFFGLEHTDNSDSVMHPGIFGTFKFSKEEIEYINKKAREMKLAAP